MYVGLKTLLMLAALPALAAHVRWGMVNFPELLPMPKPENDALQQLTYFGFVFVLALMAIVTAPSMSPALTNRFKWHPTLRGNRQIGRSIHFLVLYAFVLFVIGHVALVANTEFIRNMNHIVLGADDTSLSGVYLGLVGLGAIVAVNTMANGLAWRQPRFVQHDAKAIVTPAMKFLRDRPAPAAEFRREDISPFLWAKPIPHFRELECERLLVNAFGQSQVEQSILLGNDQRFLPL